MRGWPRHAYILTKELVLELIRNHTERHGRPPNSGSGVAFGEISWMAIDQSMRSGAHGWDVTWGRSLSDFKRRNGITEATRERAIVTGSRPRGPGKSGRVFTMSPDGSPRRRTSKARAVLEECFLQGLTVTQTAERSGLSWYTVRDHYRKFKKARSMVNRGTEI